MKMLIILQIALWCTGTISKRRNYYEEVEYLNEVKWPQEPSQKDTFTARVMAIDEKHQTRREKNHCSRQILKLRKEVECMPRNTTVDVIVPLGELILPKTVIVKRCGGTCNSRYSCIPTHSRTATFYVQKMRGREFTCSKISVSEDTECSCGCYIKKSSCNKNQYYDKNKCKCSCKIDDWYFKCSTSRNRNMVWDEETCSCLCKQEQKCTTGTYWVEEMCKCARMV